MESSELSSRYSTEEECLRHEETLKLLESWKKTLEDRHVIDDDEMSNNTITVSVGPQFEGKTSRIAEYQYSYVKKSNFKFWV